ncbi:MAG TPA: histidine kinase dimerization/phospho-acceptor domain-containing protein, partial [Calditerricola sp.]
MIWRSVVGKLWATIIGLACVVLVILGVLLLQFLDRYFYEKQSNDLKRLAEQLVALVVESPAHQDVIRVARAVVEAHDTRLVVIGLDSGEKPKRVLLDDRPPATSDVPEVPLDELLRHTALQEVLKGKEVVVRGRFPLVGAGDESGRALFEQEIVAVGEPVPLGNGTYGAFILYRTLADVETTMTHVRRLLLYAAGICIVLTTFFAFFLSTRVTEPLRLMKKAADRMAQGAFDSRVPIRTRDEIGDLARTLNRLAQQLDETIHALQREKEQLASILRSMADGVITVDRNGRVVVTNPPAERILRAWQEGDRAALPAPLVDLFQRVMREKGELSTDLSVQGRIWSVVMAPLYDRDDVRGAVAVLRDMTEERRLDKLRKDFIANVSHELRTPLAMLQGYSEAMVDDIAATPEERKEMARVIYEETRRMGRLVNDLLDL